MPKIWLDHADGHYSTRLLTDEEASKDEAEDQRAVYVQDAVYEAYLRHLGRDAAWDALWRALSNEQYMRRRESELLPLEEAAREIERLKDELARSQRTAKFFEEEWALLRTPRAVTAEDHDRFTCVSPQPGCDVGALENEEWRRAAKEILAKYNGSLAAEGTRWQGCCCGHTHRRLSADEASILRAAGFLVEDDTEIA